MFELLATAGEWLVDGYRSTNVLTLRSYSFNVNMLELDGLTCRYLE
jgi:hypothetical protein